jgi:hypothetical protein
MTLSFSTTGVSFTLLLALSSLTKCVLSTSATSRRPMSLLVRLRKTSNYMLDPSGLFWKFLCAPCFASFLYPLTTIFVFSYVHINVFLAN